jgi:hypothetical protein
MGLIHSFQPQVMLATLGAWHETVQKVVWRKGLAIPARKKNG